MNMKKLIATALAVVMIFGLVSVGFAAAPEFPDIEGNKYEKDILRLASLGVISGYDDGTFRPEDPVKRQEFAKLLVEMLGLGSVANMMKGQAVPFADVPANSWASGYINVAVTMGIINGYPDGTFKPENPVTYAEALKMILAAIGYVPEGFTPLYWPVTWVIKAHETGLSKGIDAEAALPINRGTVAGLLYNALFIPHVTLGEKGFAKVDADPTTSEVETKNFLTCLGAESVTGYVSSTPELFTVSKAEIGIAKRDKSDSNKMKDVGTYEVDTDQVEIKGLLGHKVTVWVADDEVLFLEDNTPADSVKDAVYSAPDKVKVGTSTVTIDDTVLCFRNYVSDEPLKSGDKIQVIYDGSTAVAVIAVKYETSMVTKKYDPYKRLYLDTTLSLSSDPRIDLKDLDVEYLGAATDYSEIKVGDVVDYIINTDQERAIVVVTRDKVAGLFKKLDGKKATIGTKTVTSLVTLFNDADIGKKITVYLNKDGKAVAYDTEKAVQPAEFYGVFLRSYKEFDEAEEKTLTYGVFFVDGDEVECPITLFGTGANVKNTVVKVYSKEAWKVTTFVSGEVEAIGSTYIKVDVAGVQKTYLIDSATQCLDLEDDPAVRPLPDVGDVVEVYYEHDSVLGIDKAKVIVVVPAG